MRRNREFSLLWTSQVLSDLGGAIALLAMPLLVLELTGSAVQAGVVGTAAQATRLLTRLPAGALADRMNRGLAMLICDAARLTAYLVLAATVAINRAGIAIIITVAVVDAACSALFNSIEHSALRTIVPAPDMPAAVSRNEARSYGTSLAGPPLGGLLFGWAYALPFLGNAVSFLASLIGLALIRKPLRAGRPINQPESTAALRDGIRFVFGNAFLRTVILIAAPLNFALYGSIFTIIVTLQANDVAPGVIGLTETIVGAGGLIGALAAPVLTRRLSFAVLIRGLLWAAVVFLALCSVLTTSLIAAVPIALTVLVGPACNAALFAHQAAITPNHLQGRALSVIFAAAMSAAATAPLLAGVFFTAWGSTTTVLIFAASVAVSALVASLASSIRHVIRVQEAPQASLSTEGPSMGMSH
ncbi:MFS transporter [Actinoplanes sp. URMC 104]|uniref:MFS transporter n=1 Tax=Actinoplanes sp. URMC 104 TaxID=3423409 RepID=UPI003F1CBC8B